MRKGLKEFYKVKLLKFYRFMVKKSPDISRPYKLLKIYSNKDAVQIEIPNSPLIPISSINFHYSI